MFPKKIKLLIINLLVISAISGCKTNEESKSTNKISHYSSSLISTSTSSTNASTPSSDHKNDILDININYTDEIVYEYHIGDKLNLTNLTIKVSYRDGTFEDIQVENDMVTLLDINNKETDMNSAGYIKVLINYEDLTTSYLIEVIDENAPVEKQDPLVIFNYEAGQKFYIGEEKPSVTILPETINYQITYSSDTTGYNSSEYPTVAGTYSLVVTAKGDKNYNDITVWRWFILTGQKEAPSITFNYAAGTTFYLGSDTKPTVTISDGAEYKITYSSDTTGYNSSEYPTVAGTYSLVVVVEENEYFAYAKVWRWFRLVEPTNN